jgi:DNA-binding beta-propeller fold protein YncE
MRFVRFRPASFVLLGLCAAGGLAAQQPGYAIRKTIPIGGTGGWDYLAIDTARNRLYVSHGNQVEVVDAARDTLLGVIPNTPGVHGIAIAYELGKGYVSGGRDSSVTVFDLQTLAVLQRVNVGARNPDAIGYDPFSKRVFTFNGGSASITALDAASGELLGSLAVSGKPEFWVSDGRGHMWVNIEDKGTLVAFDPQALKLLAEWPLTGCEDPTGLGFDAKRGRLFPVCGGNGKMLVVDAANGTILATLPIGQRVDGGGFDPGREYAFASAGEGKLTIVALVGGSYRVVQDVPTAPGARTMVVDPKSHRVYLSTAEYGPAPDSVPGQPRRRPPVLPGSFKVLVVGPPQ